MAFFFRTKAKSDLAKPTKDLLSRLWQPPVSQRVGVSSLEGSGRGLMRDGLQTEEELAKLLGQIKLVLQGTQG